MADPPVRLAISEPRDIRIRPCDDPENASGIRPTASTALIKYRTHNVSFPEKSRISGDEVGHLGRREMEDRDSSRPLVHRERSPRGSRPGPDADKSSSRSRRGSRRIDACIACAVVSARADIS